MVTRKYVYGTKDKKMCEGHRKNGTRRQTNENERQGNAKTADMDKAKEQGNITKMRERQLKENIEEIPEGAG